MIGFIISFVTLSAFAVVILLNFLQLSERSSVPKAPKRECQFELKDDYLVRQCSKISEFISYKSYEIGVGNTGTNKKHSKTCYHCEKRITNYVKEDVVRCFDFWSVKRNQRPIHIAFIGDSTVRQIFVNFIRLIPDYDRKIASNSTKLAEYYFHEDRYVTSHLMDNLRISFYWRELIRQNFSSDFKRWSSSDNQNQVPDIILLGVTVHHISNNNVTNSLQMYMTLLEKELLPFINRTLTSYSHQEIVWLLQNPIIEDLAPSTYGIYTSKINKYNRGIRRTFKDTGVVVWDSINTVVEEYLRACTLTGYQRGDSGYSICNDFIHPGFRAIAIGNQLIINHICETVKTTI